MAWQNRWHAPKSPVIRAFLLPKSRNISLKNEGWHWGVLRLFRELNPHKGGLWAPQKSKYKQILVLSTKNSIQSFGLGFSGFHEMWKHWDRVLFLFHRKPTDSKPISDLWAVFNGIGDSLGSCTTESDWSRCERFVRFVKRSNSIILLRGIWVTIAEQLWREKASGGSPPDT